MYAVLFNSIAISSVHGGPPAVDAAAPPFPRGQAKPMSFKSDVRMQEKVGSPAIELSSPGPEPKPTLHRTYFPETWLWDLHVAG